MDNNELKEKLAKEKTSRIRSITVGTTIITALISALVSFFTGYVNIRKDNHDHLRQITAIEMEFAEKFMDTALVEDVNLRLRFSEYFMHIYPTAAQRDRWHGYYLIIKDEYDQLQQGSDSHEIAILDTE
ncbi:MAG: hypothetical protein ABFS38_19015 [Bacteroidota bacterium]